KSREFPRLRLSSRPSYLPFRSGNSRRDLQAFHASDGLEPSTHFFNMNLGGDRCISDSAQRCWLPLSAVAASRGLACCGTCHLGATSTGRRTSVDVKSTA